MKWNFKLHMLVTATLLAGCSNLAIFDDKRVAAPEISAASAQLPFRELPTLKKAYISAKPANRGDQISIGELGKDGGNRDMVLTLAHEIAHNQHGKFDSLLIAHKNKLLFESYYLRGRVNLPHFQASATKGWLSLAVGRAIQLGYLTMEDLHKPLFEFLKQIDRASYVEGAEIITLDKALSMRSGMSISRDQIEEIEQKAKNQQGQNHIKTLLEVSPAISPETQTFNYQRVDPKLVMQVLEVVTPKGAEHFIKTELLDKLGITNYRWNDDVSGLPMAPFGSYMTSRDMLKLGILTSNNGKWDGEQLLPEKYIKKATNRIVHRGEGDIFFTDKNVTKPGYGYYWWQADMQVDDKTYFTTSAQGGGGQYVILVGELDLVIVFTAHDRDANTMQLTAEKLLPAFR